MPITLVQVSQNLTGHQRAHAFDFTMGASYPTGGEPLTPAKVGLIRVETLEIADNAGGYVLTYDRANQKLKALYGDNNNAADGPLIEVPNGTDLSAITGRLIARGR